MLLTGPSWGSSGLAQVRVYARGELPDRGRIGWSHAANLVRMVECGACAGSHTNLRSFDTLEFNLTCGLIHDMDSLDNLIDNACACLCMHACACLTCFKTQNL